MVIIYLGFNSKIRKEEAYKIIKKYFNCFTTYKVDGFYYGKKVETLKIEILTKDKTKIIKLKNKLEKEFKQKEVLLIHN